MAIKTFLFLLFLFVLIMSSNAAFSWRIQTSANRYDGDSAWTQQQARLSESRATKDLSAVHSIAIQELKELESQPLCHRIAAQQLVSNCNLIDSADESAVFQNSGRIARDFIDSYAASLAICDLVRGSFAIPVGCGKFKESVLSSLPRPNTPQLHVSTQEIDRCLEGLAKSDSAWNTWVSYRHKASRFCEASRAENEKDSTIRLHQKITTIMKRLTESIETELEEKLQAFQAVFQDANEAVTNLQPKLDKIHLDFASLQSLVSEQLRRDALESADAVQAGLRQAGGLHNLIRAMFEDMQSMNAKLSREHDQTLELLSSKVEGELLSVVASVTTAVSSTASLQKQLKMAESQASDLALRQVNLRDEILELERSTQAINDRQHDQREQLEKSYALSQELLHLLSEMASSTASLKHAMLARINWSGLWPYVICPITTLLVGSYKVAPSAMRNLALLGLGEIAAVAVTLLNECSEEVFSSTLKMLGYPTSNTTIIMGSI